MIARFCLPATSFLALCFALGILPATGRAGDEDRPGSESKRPFSVKFVDETGRPVAGVGVALGFERNQTGESVPIPRNRATSDRNGLAAVPEGRELLPYNCLVARHRERGLVAIEQLEKRLGAAKEGDPITITLHPECRVFGRLTCADLTERSRKQGQTMIGVDLGGVLALASLSHEDDPVFEFVLPPGEFQMQVAGDRRHWKKVLISVKPGQAALDLGALDMPATRLALLEGLQAPELEEIVAWKNGAPVKLTNLRGKYVILDFWGYWCGACIERMPKLFALHDKYHDHGLEIVGIHLDQGEGEKEPVDTVEKLDTRLAEVRKDVWKGQDIPYPVGLVLGKRTSYGPRITDMEARGSISAKFGVWYYPTLILIDREGKVVGEFHAEGDDLGRLETLLRMK